MDYEKAPVPAPAPSSTLGVKLFAFGAVPLGALAVLLSAFPVPNFLLASLLLAGAIAMASTGKNTAQILLRLFGTIILYGAAFVLILLLMIREI